MQIIYLIPRSGYSTDLRSDTLWGTLCWSIRHLWGDVELRSLIDRCKSNSPDFVISSAFPFKQLGKDRIPFFPNPLVFSSKSETIDDREKVREAFRLRKKLKNIRLLCLDDFRDALHGKLSAADLLHRLQEESLQKKQANELGHDYIPSQPLVARTAPKRHVNSMTHNTIDRLRGGTLTVRSMDDGELKEAGQLFHAEDIWWADEHNDSDESRPNTGLFFLADGSDEAIKKYLSPVLELLRHTGIGADRTAGKGSFDFEIAPFTMPEPAAGESNAMLNLSLFRPTPEELQNWASGDEHGCLQYRLEQREGLVGGYREKRPKTPRLYFREGSVFKRPEKNGPRFRGCIHEHKFPDLTHEVWDNGFGFMVNLNWKAQ